MKRKSFGNEMYIIRYPSKIDTDTYTYNSSPDTLDLIVDVSDGTSSRFHLHLQDCIDNHMRYPIDPHFRDPQHFRVLQLVQSLKIHTVASLDLNTRLAFIT